MSGKVYLVGAGPGDEGLITLKGLEAIKKADVILYDRLANPNLLKYKKKGSELFYVGKKAGNHYRTQEEINRLLIDKAKEGKTIARLKGGDPFVFGRGAEEGEELLAGGVQFEVVPGITSPISVAAYGGIPLTHREWSSSFTVVTGHEDPTKEESALDWSNLARFKGTLVILMGVRNLPKIAERLMKEGRNPKTPVALIRWGTRANQETMVGDLKNIAQKVEEANFKAPAIIVIGDVVNLREKLNWFESKPLFGKKIVVTRPKDQKDSFTKCLSREGAKVIEAPAIKIGPPENKKPLEEALRKVSSYHWIIFSSVNCVKRFMKRLFESGQDVRALGGVKLSAIGPKTAEELTKYGFRADYIPNDYVIESILEGFSKEDTKGKRFLLPRANLGREALEVGLKDLGAQVDNVVAYRTLMGEGNPKLKDMLEKKEIDLLTFTSSSTVDNLIKPLGEDYKELMEGVEVACIGPITAQRAREHGLEVGIVAEEYTVDGLFDAIMEYYSN
ncbi:uroporphyrinogen-III C-methyltransferase [Halonatronum saccharophilum]|uniref:uroporphyrinogen-III C-methyltransferase n=1 Tax=Halonatronum saccharophilum TaxID=150060 RepID=UPI000484F3FF|nr:uroporphyrinogen-III C-methyltransferase [Halonatronum saccharophilum]